MPQMSSSLPQRCLTPFRARAGIRLLGTMITILESITPIQRAISNFGNN